MNEGYSVLIARPEAFDRKKLASALEEFHRIPEDEAIQLARRAWGFAGENLPRERALVLADKCAENGLEAVTVDSKEVFSLPAEKIFTRAEVKPEGLNYTLETKEPGFASWENVILLAAAPVKEEKITQQTVNEGPSGLERLSKAALMAVTGIPLGTGKTKEAKKEKKEYELVFYLEIFSTDSPFRLRMRSDSFNYSYLGKRKEYSSQLNFRAMLEDVSASALKSLKNRGLNAVINKEHLSMLGYDSLSDLEKEARWLLTVAPPQKV